MAFNPQDKAATGKDFTIADEGMTLARLARVVEVGTQETQYGDIRRAYFYYSLPFQTVEIDGEEKQMMIRSKPLKISSWRDGNRKAGILDHIDALNKDAQSLADVINCPCMLNIIHTKSIDGTKTYANIDSITPVMAGQEVPELDTDPYYFDFYTPDMEVWEKLSDHLKDMIKSAVDYPGSTLESMLVEK